MPYQRYLAELLGTFALTFVVWLSVAFAMPFPTPVMAAVTLGLCVYTLGRVSGAHLNPAVTAGMFAIRKISGKDAALYALSQLVGASAAMFVGVIMSGEGVTIPHESSLLVGAAEAMGAFVLAFGVTAVTRNAVDSLLSGVVVGASLFIGIFMAFPFSNAVLNPAVALGIGSFGPMYVLGPVVGAVLGALAYDRVFMGKAARK